MDAMNRPPTTYQGWLARLYSSNSPDQMVEAATNAAALTQDKKQARLDVAKILTEKYQIELKRAGDNSMVERTVKSKYNTLAKQLFGSNVEAMVSYVKSLED